MKLNDPIGARVIEHITNRSCDAPAVLSNLSTSPQPSLSGNSELQKFSRNSGILLTPLKQLGISGWSPTGCTGQGEGILVQDAAHSSDGVFTIDVQILRFGIDGLEGPPSRFIRVEVEKGVAANSYVEKNPLRKGDKILFGGPVVFDNDPFRFLEVHPIDLLVRSDQVPQQFANALSLPAPVFPRSYTVVEGDCLAYIAERAYGRQTWYKVYRANRRKIGYPDIIFTGQVLTIPK